MESALSMMLNAQNSDCNQADAKEPDNKCTIPANNRTFILNLDAAYQKHSSQLPEKIMKSNYIDKCKYVAVEGFVNDFATKSEESVYEKMRDNENFVRVTNWCELIHSVGMKSTCNHEIPLALRAIAMTETFPDPKNADGVNFKLLYMNLSNMMIGHPVQEMNVATAKVLQNVYEDTLQQIKHLDTNELAEQLRSPCLLSPKPSTSENLSHSSLRDFLTDRNLNPLQIPFEKLFCVLK